MTKKRQSAYDPTIAEMLGDKPKPSKRRPKMTYDLPPSIITRIREVAEAENTSQSDIVAYALSQFLNAYDEGHINLDPYKRRTASLKWEWALNIPTDEEP